MGEPTLVCVTTSEHLYSECHTDCGPFWHDDDDDD